ncbi:hypothetical protein Hanom_Chr10g00890591 [Helianthus anomalus]
MPLALVFKTEVTEVRISNSGMRNICLKPLFGYKQSLEKVIWRNRDYPLPTVVDFSQTEF